MNVSKKSVKMLDLNKKPISLNKSLYLMIIQKKQIDVFNRFWQVAHEIKSRIKCEMIDCFSSGFEFENNV
jgi:hypothetical protein